MRPSAACPPFPISRSRGSQDPSAASGCALRTENVRAPQRFRSQHAGRLSASTAHEAGLVLHGSHAALPRAALRSTLRKPQNQSWWYDGSSGTLIIVLAHRRTTRKDWVQANQAEAAAPGAGRAMDSAAVTEPMAGRDNSVMDCGPGPAVPGGGIHDDQLADRRQSCTVVASHANVARQQHAAEAAGNSDWTGSLAIMKELRALDVKQEQLKNLLVKTRSLLLEIEKEYKANPSKEVLAYPRGSRRPSNAATPYHTTVLIRWRVPGLGGEHEALPRGQGDAGAADPAGAARLETKRRARPTLAPAVCFLTRGAAARAADSGRAAGVPPQEEVDPAREPHDAAVRHPVPPRRPSPHLTAPRRPSPPSAAQR